jgi:D-glycero-D-manno-heptose 1,7-bisphosphate phosphatase
MRREILVPHYHLNESGDVLFTFYQDGSSARILLSDAVETHPKSERIALIDRDGVVVEKAERHKYHTSAEAIEIIPEASEALRYLNDKGIPAIFITNQPGIYKGIMSVQDLCEMTPRIEELTKARVDSVFFCPHPAPTEGDKDAPEEKLCRCRKPKPEMVEAALRLYGADREGSIMFGDFVSDVEAAIAAGVRPVYIATVHDEYEMVQELMARKHLHVLEDSFEDLHQAVTEFF